MGRRGGVAETGRKVVWHGEAAAVAVNGGSHIHVWWMKIGRDT